MFRRDLVYGVVKFGHSNMDGTVERCKHFKSVTCKVAATMAMRGFEGGIYSTITTTTWCIMIVIVSTKNPY